MTTFWRLVALAIPTALLISVIDLHRQGAAGEAEFVLKVITGFGVVVAVIVALSGDAINNFANRIHLRIENPEQTDNFFNQAAVPEHGNQPVFCHHLKVVNMTPSRPVKDCTVWLVKILDPTVEGAFQENFRI